MAEVMEAEVIDLGGGERFFPHCFCGDLRRPFLLGKPRSVSRRRICCFSSTAPRAGAAEKDSPALDLAMLRSRVHQLGGQQLRAQLNQPRFESSPIFAH